jgi:transketolase
MAVETRAESLREVFGATLSDLAAEFPNVLVLDGDLANSTRADIFAERRPDQFYEMGIAEQNLTGVAAGLATLGFIPFISTFAAFAVKRAADQRPASSRGRCTSA